MSDGNWIGSAAEYLEIKHSITVTSFSLKVV